MSQTTTPRVDDRDDACFYKAKRNGEPTFTLRAQDLTAAPLVRLWADAQVFLANQAANGISPLLSLQVIENRLARVFEDVRLDDAKLPTKINNAYIIADFMDAFGGMKKVAD